MKELSEALFERAEVSLRGASALVPIDPDGAASRAYYSSFSAVSALFAKRGVTFVTHKAVEAAVHRDLVRTGIWSKPLGADYSFLHRLRKAGDYGGQMHVSEKSAEEAVEAARRILEAVRNTIHPPQPAK